jgi:predicted NAD/FAD-dependent oxidoreductase
MENHARSADTAVIGAGLTGAWIASALRSAGIDVLVLDKGRGPGGRLSLRRSDCGSFAHGCPLEAIATWAGTLPADALQARGLAPAMDIRDPRLQALPRHLLADLRTRYEAQVARIERGETGWRLFDASGSAIAEAQRLVLTLPCAPAWCVLLAQPADQPEPDWQALAPALAQVQAQDALPGEDARRWVLQLSEAASRERLEDSPQALLQALLSQLGSKPSHWLHAAAHRWRYARIVEPLHEPLLLDDALQLAVCGDAFAGGRGDSDLQRCRRSAETLLQRWLPASPRN